MFDLNEARRMARSYARQNDQIGIMLGLAIEALLQAQGEAQRWEAEATRLRAALHDLLIGAEQRSQSHVDVAAKCRAALAGPGGGAGEGEA